MHVSGYDLFLDMDFQRLKFDGRVLMTLESEEDVTLNSKGLNILSSRAGGKPVAFQLDNENLSIKTGRFSGTLEILFAGSIHDSLVGIYRAPYNGTYMITTQFEAADARRLFPCVDHPNYKAEFKLTLEIDMELDAISNMPIEAVSVEGGKKIVSFQKTPRMSTYLLYLGIGKFEELEQRHGSIDLSVAATPGRASRGAFALEVAKKSIDFYQFYFGIPYVLPKLHLISIPEFAAGAMENWGAITFREAALQVDKRSSTRTRKRVTEVVAHELAHQWFGNLVTMRWWNDLWLNESFATFMAYKVMDSTSPRWKVWQDFLINQASEAMSRDSLRSTHPIETDVASPSEISQIFDEISYGKGACILRMIESYLGPERFRKGIMGYLAKHKLSNATGSDFWNALEAASGEKVSAIMSEWIGKQGYPLVTVSISGGKLILQQERFLLSGESEKDTWPIPIALRLQGESRRLMLYSEEEVIEIRNLESLKLNIDHMGFYRVCYKGLYDHVWRSELSAIDKWEIIFDALALMISGKMSLSEYLGLVKRYYIEDDYAPSLEVSNQLAFLNLIIPESVADVSREFHKSQLKILEGKTDENSSILRSTMARRLVMIDQDYAEELGTKFRNYDEVDPDMKEAVAIGYARARNDFEGILSKYRAADSDEERIRLLNALMSFVDRSLVALALDLTLSGEVKRQDVGSAVLTAAANPDARDVTWTWFKVNIGVLRKLYEGTARLSRILSSIIPILGIGRVEEVARFFKENEIPEAEKGIEAGIEKLRIYDNLVARS